MPSTILSDDSTWVQQSFLVPLKDLASVDQNNRYFSTASLAYADTKPGGNLGINQIPAFTRTADLRAPNRLNTTAPLGRYYHEAFNENKQVIHMRFGVTAFNSLTSFFTSFYDTRAGQLARTGRSDSLFYNFGVAAGLIVQVLNWQLLAVHLIGTAIKYFSNVPRSRFAYLKPTMPLYWNAVQSMVNQIAVNRGIVPRVGANNPQAGDLNNVAGQYDSWSSSDSAILNQLLPDIFEPNGQIDVYKLATRYHRIERKWYKQMESLSNGDSINLNSLVQQMAATTISDNAPLGYQAYLQNWLSASAISVAQGGTDASTQTATSGDTSSTTPGADDTTEDIATLVDNDDSFGSFLSAEFDDGGAFASFRVNYTGSVSEQFTSSHSPSDIQEKINSASSSARAMKFNLADGNVSDGIIGSTIQGILGAAGDVVAGAADSLGVSGLASLAGAALVDIPHKWDGSTANLPKGSYTIELRSPYGNPVSQMINLYIPLCMLLAGALPLAAGKASYTSPFVCEMYDRGRCQTRYGMIDSVSVTRGVGNLGFNREGNAMGIDVSFTVVDLSSILYMPIAQGISLGSAAVMAAASATGSSLVEGVAAAATVPGIFDDQSVFSDYMAILSAMGLSDQIYAWRRFKLNVTRALADTNTFFDKAHMASFLGNTLPGRLMGMFYRGIDQ
jgi:hypothetical protein